MHLTAVARLTHCELHKLVDTRTAEYVQLTNMQFLVIYALLTFGLVIAFGCFAFELMKPVGK